MDEAAVEAGEVEDGQLFPAMEIRDALGVLADGGSVDPRLTPFLRAAVAGPCRTADRGVQQFVVGVSESGLFNVDTEELIWPRALDAEVFGGDVPLRVLTDRDLWERERRRWDEEDPRAWVAFVWRVAVPLFNHLRFRAAWR